MTRSEHARITRISFLQVMGALIRRQRRRCKLRQSDVAYVTGISASTWSRIESGLTDPSIAVLRRIAGPLDVSASQILRTTERLLELLHQEGYGDHVITSPVVMTLNKAGMDSLIKEWESAVSLQPAAVRPFPIRTLVQL